MMNIKGAFVGKPVKKQVTWRNDGQDYEADVYVRKLSYHSAVSDVLSYGGKSDPVAGRIASCICDEDGKQIFTVQDITGEGSDRGALCSGLTVALLNVISEVNGLGKSESET